MSSAQLTGMDMATPDDGVMRAADGTPLKRRLARALRREKLRSFMLIAPLLFFIILSFLLPIADMLFRSVENQIVENTIPRTVVDLGQWDTDQSDVPPESTFEALYYDLFTAVEARRHTRLGQRLNYELSGMSSLFRGTGRDLDNYREDDVKALEDAAPALDDGAFWVSMMGGDGGGAFLERRKQAVVTVADIREGLDTPLGFTIGKGAIDLLPRTSSAYADWGVFTVFADEDAVAEETPWEAVFVALASDLRALDVAELSVFDADIAEVLTDGKIALEAITPPDFAALFEASDADWVEPETWRIFEKFSSRFTGGYYLSAIDADSAAEGFQLMPEDERIYIKLFIRTIWMSLLITVSTLVLGYPIAYLMSHTKRSTANLLMILVLLPFWTSLLVRTSAWKVLLQQQGVINDFLVWINLIDDAGRLVMINNQLGTIIAMTHILLPFMILPLYSVMQTISPSYVRAAKSMGANDWTAFWRVYFPNTIPGIGAGAILVFILAIGYYITPELVGGTQGVFISNRIAFHISSSLNWGLAAALGAILLLLVLVLFYCYDKIVGIDNVKLG